MQKRRYQPSFFVQIFCIRFVVFGTNTYFVNCYPFCFVAMHTPEKQCVSKAIAIKISTLAFALVLCLLAFFLHKHVFCKFSVFMCMLNIQIENPA